MQWLAAANGYGVSYRQRHKSLALLAGGGESQLKKMCSLAAASQPAKISVAGVTYWHGVIPAGVNACKPGENGVIWRKPEMWRKWL